MVNYVLWLPYLVTRTAETMVKESKKGRISQNTDVTCDCVQICFRSSFFFSKFLMGAGVGEN